MKKLVNQSEILEFIFDCSKRDKLMMSYLQREKWTPAEGAMIVCGVKPLPGRQTEIPNTAFGIDEAPLIASSQRLRNARAILENWQEEFEDEGQNPKTEITPCDFYSWCIDSFLITDWLRLISSFSGGEIEPGFSIAYGGVSDTERITIFPPALISELLKTAKTKEVLHQTIHAAIAPENRYPSEPSTTSIDPVQPKPEVLLCQKLNPTPIDIAIDLAKRLAIKPNNYQSVWEALVTLAQQPNRPPPITGYDEDRGGVKIQPEDKMATDYIVFKKSALRQRMFRNEKSAAKKTMEKSKQM